MILEIVFNEQILEATNNDLNQYLIYTLVSKIISSTDLSTEAVEVLRYFRDCEKNYSHHSGNIIKNWFLKQYKEKKRLKDYLVPVILL